MFYNLTKAYKYVRVYTKYVLFFLQYILYLLFQNVEGMCYHCIQNSIESKQQQQIFVQRNYLL